MKTRTLVLLKVLGLMATFNYVITLDEDKNNCSSTRLTITHYSPTVFPR